MDQRSRNRSTDTSTSATEDEPPPPLGDRSSPSRLEHRLDGLTPLERQDEGFKRAASIPFYGTYKALSEGPSDSRYRLGAITASGVWASYMIAAERFAAASGFDVPAAVARSATSIQSYATMLPYVLDKF